MSEEMRINCSPDAGAERVVITELTADEVAALHMHEASDQLRRMRYRREQAVMRLRELAMRDEVAECVMEILGLEEK
jgi:hypothetical protein